MEKPSRKMKLTPKMEMEALMHMGNEPKKVKSTEMLAAGLTQLFGIVVNRHDANRIRDKEAKHLQVERAAKRQASAWNVQHPPKGK